MRKALKHKTLAKALSLFFALIIITGIPLSAQAGSTPQKIVRVGWFDSSYNTLDESGRRSGYAYEYQLKLSAYNGWKYEYVDGSWSDLFQMLIDGEIDLLSDISYTEERADKILYPNLPMGNEEYFLFVARDNRDISSTDISSLNGKKVGVDKNSYQEQLFNKWVKDNGIKTETVSVTTTEEESLQMVEKGELDAYVTVDSFMDPDRAVPLFKIGSSDYYFAVSKKRPDLLDDLNLAMSKIQDENRYYNQQLYEKYIRTAGANAFFTTQETQWIKTQKTVRIGYRDNYMPFCSQDENGNLTGILKDYLRLASNSVSNVEINFETKAYPNTEEAMKAMRNGDIDCVFPTNLVGYEAETQSVVTTPAIVSSEVYAVVRMSDPNIFDKHGPIVAAVNKGNLNYEAVLAEQYPNWEKAYFEDTPACLKGVANGEADCLLISNYRMNSLSRLTDKYHLTTISVSGNMEYRFAVKKGETQLYSILAKTTSMVPESTINASLTRYVTEDSKLSIRDIIEDYLPYVLAITAAIGIIILLLLIQNVKAIKRARRLISATEIDDLTGLYTRKYFFQYANRVYRDKPQTPMDAIVLNIEQFHAINALYGRDLGDRILRVLGNEIHNISKENDGIAGRFEADRFDIYCKHIDDYAAVFDRMQKKLDEIPYNANIQLRMGVMSWQENMEPEQLFDRARTACNLARGHYDEHLIIYDEKVSAREEYEQRLVNDLRHALESDEFEVCYQPKFDIQSEPARLVSAEALVRWRHAELGVISPSDFIPLFEHNGQIGRLDRYVWSKVAQQIEEWNKEYGVTIPISVNLSRVDLFDPELTNTLEQTLKEHNLNHDAFRLEVTESAYTENTDRIIPVVKDLRDMGFKFEMDDFGTGYSSLNMLSEMPIDGLKMDRAFVRNINIEKNANYMVELILDIAKTLSVPVIAEGVETDEQLALLKELGCEMVQGYYFSKPVSADEFETKYIKNSNNQGED